MTVLELIQSTTKYFENHGVESPRLNIEHLLAHSLGKRRMDLYLEFDRPLSEREIAPLREMVKRRAGGEPLQHLMGTVEFCGLEFLCDNRALIPRPETEQLVELAINLASAPSRILDVCTGSGVIALALASKLPDAHAAGTDISEDAVALANENVARLGLQQRVEIFRTDLFPGDTQPFDLIVSNPPYIPTGDISGLSREVRSDPAIALDGGSDGLDLIRRIVNEAGSRMSAGTVLLMEIGHDQADRVTGLLEAENYGSISVHQDYQRMNRFISAIHG